MDWNSEEDCEALVARLTSLSSEQSWVEFKSNFEGAEEIGQYISALSNSAAMSNQDYGYLIWGVRDEDHAVTGTAFDPYKSKGKGNEDLIPWVTRHLEPGLYFEFQKITINGEPVVIMRVPAAESRPAKFRGSTYVRVGSYKKDLKFHPDYERALWDSLRERTFEESVAKSDLRPCEVFDLLDVNKLVSMREDLVTADPDILLEQMRHEGIVRYDVANQWQITTGGALLYAQRLSEFPKVERKALRVIHYDGDSRNEGKREITGQKGYITGFHGMRRYVGNLLPASEVIDDGIRVDKQQFPDIIIRELVANSLIHQDLSVTGAGPMVEIFDNRIEFTNPGSPLVPPMRFIDMPARSRNEFIASQMRKVKIADERGSGWDKIAFALEYHQLPPARVEEKNGHTIITVFAPKNLADMTKTERALAAYQHACLNYVNNKATNNESIRGRFGLGVKKNSTASRIISDAIAEGLLVKDDETAGKNVRYLPFWVKEAAALGF